jgi:hypothetical protein
MTDREVKRLTPNSIANLLMADEAWHDSLYVKAEDYDSLLADFEALRTALAAPSEDIDALRRDADRYRWLRGEHSRIDPCIKANAKYKLERQSSTWVEIHDLDAAIDAAIKEDKT